VTKTLDGLRVLVVDDEHDIRLGLSRLVQSLGARAVEAGDGREALQRFEEQPVDLVLTDLMMPKMGGAELLDEVKRRSLATPVVILTGFGTVQTAVSCLQAGASHFLTKPFDNDEILRLVSRIGGQLLGSRESDRSAVEVIAEDPSMRRVIALVDRVANSPVPVLIEGESGSGKEVVARLLHAKSSVKDLPFVAVNTAALSDSLLESELFGHAKGAFTGADQDRAGLFESARGGTVFLDEVASMSPSFQGKLLRVLQDKLVRRVGATTDIPVEFRLITASNRDLADLVARGEFREDLFYRLRVVNILVPPLRSRPLDIVPLAQHFLRRAAETCLGPNAAPPQLGGDAIAALEHHRWPGNVRELENAIQRAVIVCSGDTIRPYHLGLDETPWARETNGSTNYEEAKRSALEGFQREFVSRALEQSHGNVSQAAEACGLTRAAFQRILKQLAIDRRDFE